jgi:hypothetical protein
LSGGLSNGPLQNVAPIEENYAAVGHLLSSDSKRSVDLEDTKDVSTSVLDVNQSVQPSPSMSRLHISAVEPIPTPSLEAHSNGDICSTEHDFENQQTAGVQGTSFFFQLELHFFSFVLLFTPFSNISILLVSYQLSSSVRPCGSMRHLATVCQQLNVSQKDTFNSEHTFSYACLTGKNRSTYLSNINRELFCHYIQLVYQ